MALSSHDKFIWKSALIPFAIAFSINFIIIAGVFIHRTYRGTNDSPITPVRVHREVLGESIEPNVADTVPTNTPSPIPTEPPTPSPSPSPSPPPSEKQYRNNKYQLAFSYPYAWDLKETFEQECHKDGKTPLDCNKIELTSPAGTKIHLIISDSNNAQQLKTVTPQVPMEIKNIGYAQFQGKRVYWNIMFKQNQKAFICYGKRYKLCDKHVFTVGNASVYVYGGDINGESILHEQDIPILHQIVSTISPS